MTDALVGQRIGPYEVVSKLGEGGMGQVYRARDTKLQRDVAIKLLAAIGLTDPDRRVRFEREARALAALNHPNIATIHGIEDAAGAPAIVMELVEGETLADRIARSRRGLPVAEALTIARQIADALDAAHEKGIVHRDLKPANVAITADGRVKVLDFGLAKLTRGDASASDAADLPTVKVSGTRDGMVIGTVPYMSPEQARGLAVDKRSDIWSFGCVLFEMLTGRAAFLGDTASDTIARILEREPDWTAVPPLPPLQRRVLTRCLEKDLNRRLRDIADARVDLTDAVPEGAVDARTAKRSKWSVAAMSSAAMIGAAAVGIATLVVSSRRAVQDPIDTRGFRFAPIAAEPEDETSPSWSPDGRTIAYTSDIDGVRQVLTRTLDAAVSTPITKGATDCTAPFWSPDGTRIFFISFTSENPASTLWSIGASGGEPQRVLENVAAATLSRDGDALAFLRGPGGNRSLWITHLKNPDPQQYRMPPFPEPIGLSTSVEFSPDGTQIGVLVRRQEGLTYTSELWIVPYPTGTPRRVLERIPEAAEGRMSWAADNRHVVWNSRFPERLGSHLYVADTKRGTFRQITSGAADEVSPSVSRSGDRIAFATGTDDSDLFTIALDGSFVRPLLASSRSEMRPTWSPSGKQFAYVTDAHGTPEIWMRSIDEGWTRPIVKRDPESAPWVNVMRPSLSPDGQRVVYEVWAATHSVWVAPVADGRGVPVDRDSVDQHSPAWSPDGKWIAYQRLSGGKWELVKVPFGGGTPIRIGEATPGGGDHTAWSPTGEWIAHIVLGTFVLTAADGHTEKRLSGPPPATFGFSHDGSLLYLVRRAENPRWALITVDVRTWQERSTTPLSLSLSPSAAVSGFSLHPDGKSFATGIAIARHDIWVLDGFRLRVPGLAWF